MNSKHRIVYLFHHTTKYKHKKRVPLNTYLYKLVSGAESGDQLMSYRIKFSTYVFRQIFLSTSCSIVIMNKSRVSQDQYQKM